MLGSARGGSSSTSQSAVGFVITRTPMTTEDRAVGESDSTESRDVFSTYRGTATIGDTQSGVSRKVAAVRDTGCVQTLILTSALPDPSEKPESTRTINRSDRSS